MTAARVSHRQHLLGQHPGARRLLAQLKKTARCRAVDNPTILDDHGNLVRSLQHGDVRRRIAVPNDDVGKLPGAITPISPSRPMSRALRPVLATIASIGVMPTSLTNNSASLPCHLPWAKAEALPLSLPLRIAIPRARALRIIWKFASSCLRSRSRTRSPKPLA